MLAVSSPSVTSKCLLQELFSWARSPAVALPESLILRSKGVVLQVSFSRCRSPEAAAARRSCRRTCGVIIIVTIIIILIEDVESLLTERQSAESTMYVVAHKRGSGNSRRETKQWTREQIPQIAAVMKLQCLSRVSAAHGPGQTAALI